MRRPLIVLLGMLLIQLFAVAGLAQPDRLQGRWEGTAQSPRGEQQVVAIFKKEGNGYTGTLTGTRGELPLKEIKLDGDKLTAKAEITSPQGSFLINYKLVLQGETLKGDGEVEFGGQTYRFAYDLKRVSDASAAASPPASRRPEQQRRVVPQPQQKQSLDYFVGRWNFKWIGRESPLGSGDPREGAATFKMVPDGKALDGVIEGKSDAGSFRESALIRFDEEKKTLTLSERRSNGLEIQSTGDWTHAILIRFDPVTLNVKGQTVRLKRTLTPISAYSFTLIEELSVEGGPFERLGQATFTKISSGTAP